MIDIKKFVTALLNFFPKDIYIYKNKFILAGEASENETVGYFYVELSDEVIDLFHERKLDDSSIYHLDGIRNHKEDFFESLVKVKKQERIKSITEKMEMGFESYKAVTGWENFSFSEEDINILFESRRVIHMGTIEDGNYLILSKSMVPNFSSSNYKNYLYSFVPQPKFGLNSMVISVDGPFFTAWMIYFILPVQ